MKYKKVKDPKKKVTSKTAKRILKKKGYHLDYVEFYKDYGESGSPFKKTYKYLKTGHMVDVYSTIPRTLKDGTKIDASFQNLGNKFKAKNNVFKLDIDKNTVKLKSDKKVTYTPQLFINDVEEIPGKPILKDDPLNERYHNNVIEWEYKSGVRRIRIIEGRYFERWLFDSINGKVEIKHNFKGDLKPNLGYGRDSNGKVSIQVVGDSEIFHGKSTNLVIGATENFTADTDGYVERIAANSTWSSLVTGDGTDVSDSDSYGEIFDTFAASSTDEFNDLTRAFYFFDTSTISGRFEDADFSVYGKNKSDGIGITPNLAVYGCDPSSTSSLTASDYQTVEDTRFSSIISYGAFSTSGYNDFTLNSSGIAAISTSGYTKFCLRNPSYDVANTQPSWSASSRTYILGYYSEQGTGYEPKLTITYLPSTEYIRLDTNINPILNLSTPIDLEKVSL